MKAFYWIVALAAAAPLCAEDQDQIDYRIHIMRTLAAETASIDMIAQQRAPADALDTHAKVLAVVTATVKSSFEPKHPSSHAKADIWSNWPDFTKRLEALVAATDDFAKAPAAAKLPAIEQACKGCHDTYGIGIK